MSDEPDSEKGILYKMHIDGKALKATAIGVVVLAVVGTCGYRSCQIVHDTFHSGQRVEEVCQELYKQHWHARIPDETPEGKRYEIGCKDGEIILREEKQEEEAR